MRDVDFSSIVSALNLAFWYFRDEAKKNNLLPFEDWSFRIDGLLWNFFYEKPFKESSLNLQSKIRISDILDMGFSAHSKPAVVVNCWMNLRYVFALLQANILGAPDIAKALVNVLLAGPITVQEFKHIVKPLYLKHRDKIEEALWAWMQHSSYSQSGKLGAALYRYKDEIPKEFKQSPNNTLYRVIGVSNELFNKVLTGNKKTLMLKNRTYSSWTYDLAEAKVFGKKQVRSHPELTPVLFRKKFSGAQIFLNVTKLAQFLNIKSQLWHEKEIIVRNVLKDFTFTPKDIYLYAKDKKWLPFGVEDENS